MMCWQNKESQFSATGTEGRLEIEWPGSHIPHSVAGFPMTTEDIKCHDIIDNV